MRLPIHSRRVVSQCLSCEPSPVSPIHRQQRRTAMSDYFRRDQPKVTSDEQQRPKANPVLDEYRQRNPESPKGAQRAQQMPVPGDIAPSSVFEDDRRIQKQLEEEKRADEVGEDGDPKVGGSKRDRRVMSRVLNPDPNARERWERKKVIQMVRKGGRLSKDEFIKRTEREHLVRSHNMKTSVKKLGMLARQIQGKSIDDAIQQMRFSKKLIAAKVLDQLEAAKNEAIVMRGMGLGKVASREDGPSPYAAGEDTASAEQPSPLDIRLKDGRRHRVDDTSRIYIDQAWVGRGPYGKLPDFRARGRVFLMRTPWTSLTVLLKEEATRVREHADREAKREKRRKEKVWVPLPDRPIQVQRQWYSW